MNNSPLLGAWLMRFFTEHLVTERNLAVNTQKGYRDTFLLLLPYICNRARKSVNRLSVQDVTVQRVMDFLQFLETERGCSVQTRNQRLTAIRSFARYVSSRDPACIDWATGIRDIATKKSSSQLVGWLTAEEMQLLLDAPDAKTSRGQTEHAILLFLYNTGARVSEAIGLQLRDFQFRQHNGRHALVTLRGKGGRIRQCPLWSRTEKALSEVTRGKSDADFVFLSQLRKPYTRFGVYRLVERNAAKVPSLRKRQVTPHVIRHSCACHLLRAGVDLNTIRAWLGHVSLNTTNVYAEIDLQMKTEAMRLCEATALSSTHGSWKRDKGIMYFLESR